MGSDGMGQSREEIRRERAILKKKYGKLFDQTAALLFRHDPARINFEVNTHEYELETGTILPRLTSCHSADDVRRVVHEEFVRWFDHSTAGPERAYSKIAAEIWELWSRQ